MPTAQDTTIFASHALLSSGWAENVRIDLSANGTVSGVETGANSSAGADHKAGILLPAPSNLHSHAFQRAMAGMSERRGQESRDSFWTWRQIMFRFLDTLTPDDVEAIAAFVQMEMLEGGYAGVGEFHYLHHQPGGEPYGNLAEISERIVSAASATGIGLTLLPVLYTHGGCDKRPLAPGQIRFGNAFDRFQKLHDQAGNALKSLDQDCILGVAPHSLRAVDVEGLLNAVALAGQKPLHMHLAEQVAEVEEVLAAVGKRPVEWLLENHGVSANWCLIHCTQMTPEETRGLAATGAVAGLCPITESSLGDGIFEGVRYLEAGGKFGVGSDSNIRISLSEELRTLEYSQRLRDKCRASVATPDKSTGRVLFDGAVSGSAQACGRKSGQIAPGCFADLVALDAGAIDLEGRAGDEILDAYIFAGDDRMVQDVWSAGRHVVTGGTHVKGDEIRARYRSTMSALRARL
ncbi:formimidoylglutamate deiminase [Roseibium hamelinense]|uniref:Formimidoylglutamate deiminase n=1 Tax=Roseibium hamelinense TaxID=150831 RepID=A0A562TB50_9HYPH|nr:formimidoylglutamate deiminase [Roseibium hamelinense]MTI45519.1 formimidoylglutamate deiminase [Roseibium hamelinense]TWI90106.1 formimidoylglutamate deiminase [Roseibium hamelinense]